MKKKGFTLIELLAVIVILAIIALIATPLVLKYIEKSRQESFEVSVESIKRDAINYVASNQLKGRLNYPIIIDVQDLDFKGKTDEYKGNILVYADGTVEEHIENNNYIVNNNKSINKKNEAYLIFKEGHTGIIDEKNMFVYSFSDEKSFRVEKFTEDVVKSIFEAKNSIINVVDNSSGTYSTGAKIQLLDDNNNLLKEYEIVIFGDVTGDGQITLTDVSDINSHLEAIKNNNVGTLNKSNLKAADIDHNGVVNEADVSNLASTWRGITQKFANSIN